MLTLCDEDTSVEMVEKLLYCSLSGKGLWNFVSHFYATEKFLEELQFLTVFMH